MKVNVTEADRDRNDFIPRSEAGIRGVPSLEISSFPVTPEVARLLPAEFAKRHRVLPLEIREGVLRLATTKLDDQTVVDDARLITGLDVEEVLVPENEIIEKIAETYQVTVERMLETLNETSGSTEKRNLHDIEVMANEPTVINLVNVIISAAVGERASDIHLVPFENGLQLRYRIDGLLQEKPPPPRTLHAALVSRVKIMADMNIAERIGVDAKSSQHRV